MSEASRLLVSLSPLKSATGVLESIEPYSDGLILARYSPRAAGRHGEGREAVGGWAYVAMRLSEQLPGQFWVSSSGITWQNGSRSTWIASPENLPEILKARDAVYDLTGSMKAPWSPSSCARLLLKWTGVTHQSREAERFRAGSGWQYVHVRPGQLARAHLFDVKACYYSILKRMPSPRMVVLPSRVVFQPLPAAERQRWREMLERVESAKRLRNSLVGIMGSKGRGQCWCKGRLTTGGETSGKLRPAALLVVRTAYELCQDAVEETSAVYANTDCVVTADCTAPYAWRGVGLDVSLKASGEADIVNLGNYRVGEHKTKWYTRGENRHPAVTVSQRVTRERWSGWLWEAA